MTPQEVFDYYGGKSQAAKELGVSYQAVDKWDKAGVVPDGRQAIIQLKTDGHLVADTKAA